MHEEVLKSLRVSSAEISGAAIGARWLATAGPRMQATSPIDGQTLALVSQATEADAHAAIDAAAEAFLEWRLVPAPRRGELVRRFGNKLRQHKAALAELVAIESGKIREEAAGEVQEMIDICDLAVGLSRQLHGLTIASERPGHRMMEQWHPLGPVGVISAFNFPVAVWSWNAAVALVCGDTLIWKPSEKTPLCAAACHNLLVEVAGEMPEAPKAISSVLLGGADLGRAMAASEKVPLVSATGSVPMGRSVGEMVARRLGRSLLELGGNNGMILAPSADLALAVPAIAFAAAGTAGQRCTTLRRLIVHNSLRGELVDQLETVLGRMKIGNPLDPGVLIGPLIDAQAGDAMARALESAQAEGGEVRGGGRVTDDVPEGGIYVRPALVEIGPDAGIVREETFAPILYVMGYDELDEAIAMHNAVPQGLSSAIFTSDVREAEAFMGPAGSDCGITNVNIGTSGAEIGGAFGGEKWTGGGRESGSDAWKAYMRRTTNTINYSHHLPLAQGITFDV